MRVQTGAIALRKAANQGRYHFTGEDFRAVEEIASSGATISDAHALIGRGCPFAYFCDIFGRVFAARRAELNVSMGRALISRAANGDMRAIELYLRSRGGYGQSATHDAPPPQADQAGLSAADKAILQRIAPALFQGTQEAINETPV